MKGKTIMSLDILPSATWSEELPHWSITVCGDWAPFGGHETTIWHTPSQIYGDLLPILQDLDLTIVNS